MSTQGYLDLKNQMRIAAWRWRWASQGGSFCIAARPLQDLRNDADRARWRLIEFKVRHCPKGRRVVNLAAVRIERARRKRRDQEMTITETWDARRG
jgi:hypothetical protein